MKFCTIRPYLTAFVVLSLATAAGAQNAPAPAGASSTSELVTRLKRAVEQRDSAAVASLVYWGNATSAIRASFISNMLMDAGPIEYASTTSLGDDEMVEYVREGIKYHVTLPPLGHVRLQYPKRAGSSIAVEPVYGAKDGRYFLVTAEPLRKSGK